MGGRYWPEALIAYTTVTVEPRSALVIFDTCRFPFVDRTLHGFATLVMPDSSIFHTVVAVKL